MSMITVKNLKKSFGDHEVLKDINAVIEEKEVVCVIGPSGSGKSTFLRCLNKLEDITGWRSRCPRTHDYRSKGEYQ